MWHIKDEDEYHEDSILAGTNTVSNMKSLQLPEYGIKKPVTYRKCPQNEKVRAINYNSNTKVSYGKNMKIE